VGGAPNEVLFEIDQAQQPDPEAPGEERQEGEHVRGVAPPCGVYGRIDWFTGLGEDIPQQEEQDAGGHGIQEGLDGAGRLLQAGER
jgi:hypothetical protein